MTTYCRGKRKIVENNHDVKKLLEYRFSIRVAGILMKLAFAILVDVFKVLECFGNYFYISDDRNGEEKYRGWSFCAEICLPYCRCNRGSFVLKNCSPIGADREKSRWDEILGVNRAYRADCI